MRGWRLAISLRTDGYSLVDKAFNDVEIESLRDPTPVGRVESLQGEREDN